MDRRERRSGRQKDPLSVRQESRRSREASSCRARGEAQLLRRFSTIRSVLRAGATPPYLVGSRRPPYHALGWEPRSSELSRPEWSFSKAGTSPPQREERPTRERRARKSR